MQVQITLYTKVGHWAQLNKTKKEEEALSLLFVCPEYLTDIYLLLGILILPKSVIIALSV